MCNCHPDSPFHWAEKQQLSIFARDNTFTAKNKEGQSIGQIVTTRLDKLREEGQAVGKISGLSKKNEDAILAYKQFGVYSKAVPSVRKPNKHEEDAPSKRKLKETND
jgi:hypothetical protein